jgi:hypothetical protein
MTLRKMKKTNKTNRALSIVVSEFFWDGIIASRMPRVATAKAPGGEPGTP